MFKKARMKNRKQFLKTMGLGMTGIVMSRNPGHLDKNEPPRLEFAFTATISLGPVQELGDTPHGRRRIIPITGGIFYGPAIKGTIEPGGADWQIVRTDKVAELDAQYTLKTDDGVFIYIKNKGYRHGPTEVIERLAQGEAVEPKEYYFRATPVFETAAEKYSYLNKYIYIASGERRKDSVVIHFYKVL
jgi:Protein of unknown function (DUF3237)